MNINQHLAEKVMGFRIKKDDKHSSNPDFYYQGDRMVCIDFKWNPSENIEQAMMCLDSFDYWSFFKHREDYVVDIAGQKKDVMIFNESKTMAISLACAKATGWEDD